MVCRLALNLKKTKFMIFARQCIDLTSVSLNINKHTIEQKSECRFVIMDDKFLFSCNIAITLFLFSCIAIRGTENIVLASKINERNTC